MLTLFCVRRSRNVTLFQRVDRGTPGLSLILHWRVDWEFVIHGRNAVSCYISGHWDLTAHT